MRPSSDHIHPQKRRRVENHPNTSSPSSAQPNSFLNNTLLLPQLPFNHSNPTQNPQPHITLPPSDLPPPLPFLHTNHTHPFGNPSAPLQNSSIPSSNPSWTPQLNSSNPPEFTSPNALDDFFTSQPNQPPPSTLASHQPLLNPALQSNGNYPALLPPLVPGKAPPFAPLGPLSTFSPASNNFPIAPPLHDPFLPSNLLPNISASSPPTVHSSFPLQPSSSIPTPAMRQRIGPRIQNGQLVPLHHHTTSSPRPSSSRFHTSRVLPPKPGINPMANNPTTRPRVSLGSIPPVRKALELFRDESPIMVALAQTIMQTDVLPPLPSAQRSRIFDFTGFPREKDLNHEWLLSLSKSDLDMLAWVFVVSKHGRKDDVARRIVASLRAPLQLRVPPEAKRPDIPTRADANNSLGTLAAVIRNAPQTTRTSSTRANMPSLAPAPLRSSRGHMILSNLQRQLAPSNARGMSVLSSQSGGRLSSHANKSKHMQNLCSEVLNGYSFDVGENPFNRPVNSPLGLKPYVVFSSVQLSRGNNDPVLRFETPSPIDKTDRPEVEGGDVQVHIRCLRVEIEKPKSEWKQAWPFPATCRVNGHSVVLSQAQRYTNGKLAGRDAATNITPFLRKFKGSGMKETNKIVLRRQASTATAATGQYVFFAQEVLVLNHETMTKSVFEASEKYWVEHRANLEKKGVITPATSKFEMARQGVMQFLTDPDGLTVSSMKVSLRCPLALTRIATPVKGKKCQHVQCFDLENFLEYARRSSKFDCPVCNKSTAYPAMLVISPYIEHALATFEDCDEVEINQDGSMVAVERKQNGVASDDDEDADVKTEPRNISSRSRGAGTGSGAKTPEVVDLTLDSDEDCGTATNGDQQSELMPPDAASSIPLGGGGLLHTSGGSAGPANQIESSSPLAQDMFSFRADFCWREPQISNNFGASSSRLPQSQGDIVRDNWPADVIAIDSD